jgi:phosphatidylglycerophosphate synthase
MFRSIGNIPVVGVLLAPANWITVGRMVGIVIICVAVSTGHFGPGSAAGAVFVLVYWASDHFDGWVARKTRTASNFGECLDLFSDRFCDICLCSLIIHSFSDSAIFAYIFLLCRISPDIIIGRFVGSAANTYSGLLQKILPRLNIGAGASWYGVLLAGIIRAAFFYSVIFGARNILIDAAFLLMSTIYAVLFGFVLFQVAAADAAGRK